MWFSTQEFLWQTYGQHNKYGNSEVISSKIRNKTGYQASPLLFNKILEVFTTSIKQEQKRNDIKTGKGD